MNPLRAALLAVLLGIIGFSLALELDPWASTQGADRDRTGSLLQVLLGDGRRLFANHFFAKADAYFHRGVYPSIFDAPRTEEMHMVSEGQNRAPNGQGDHPGDEGAEPGAAPHAEPEEDQHPEGGGRGTDWIASLNNHFTPAEHAHLSGSDAREMLPWIRLAAELDPQRIETYVVAAFFLAQRLGRTDEAEQFLREGLRANPNHPELLLELAELYRTQRNDPAHARNLLEIADREWSKREASKPQPDNLLGERILVRLGLLEEKAGRLPQAVEYFRRAKAIAGRPAALEAWIDELQRRIAAVPATNAPPATVSPAGAVPPRSGPR